MMAANNFEPSAIWTILWDSLEGSSHDLRALKPSARDDARFIEDLGLDSLDLLEFYLRLDEAFDLSLTADDYPALNSVQDIIAFVEGRVATS
jgi:acyl carrier protein